VTAIHDTIESELQAVIRSSRGRPLRLIRQQAYRLYADLALPTDFASFARSQLGLEPSDENRDILLGMLRSSIPSKPGSLQAVRNDA